MKKDRTHSHTKLPSMPLISKPRNLDSHDCKASAELFFVVVVARVDVVVLVRDVLLEVVVFVLLSDAEFVIPAPEVV